jgi:hypothetical protein
MAGRQHPTARKVRLEDEKIIEMIEETGRLERDVKAKDETISQLLATAEKFEEELENSKSKDERISQLLAKVEKLEEDLQKSDTETARKVRDAVMQATATQLDGFGLLQPAGMAWRNKVLTFSEPSKPKQEKYDIGKVSHWKGLALADAWLYSPSCPARRTDTKPYFTFYAMHPEFVWLNRDCEKFLEVLDYQGAITTILAQQPGKVERRQKTFDEFRNQVASKPTTWSLNRLQEFFSANNGEKFTKMREEYTTLLRFLISKNG